MNEWSRKNDTAWPHSVIEGITLEMNRKMFEKWNIYILTKHLHYVKLAVFSIVSLFHISVCFCSVWKHLQHFAIHFFATFAKKQAIGMP